MKITELETLLHRIKYQHGDINVSLRWENEFGELMREDLTEEDHIWFGLNNENEIEMRICHD